MEKMEENGEKLSIFLFTGAMVEPPGSRNDIKIPAPPWRKGKFNLSH